MEAGRVALTLFLIILVIVAAYYATYYIGAKSTGRSRIGTRNKNINLIDRFAISRDKSFCIVEVAGKVYVIGITNQSMTLLDTLDAAAFAETGAHRSAQPTWSMAPGGRFTRRMTKKLAIFIARKMGRPLEFQDDESSGAFAQSMKNAREKNETCPPDRKDADQTGNPEVKE